MRVLITGAKGQLGRALQAVLDPTETFSIDLPEHDILDRDKLNEAVLAFRPELIIHSAAFTNVDGCARDPDLAYRVNALGTRNVALACQLAECAMAYISTNEVFDGSKTEAYLEFDQPRPINVYAHSKWAGEQITRDLLSKFYIVRTAWLYGQAGNNFVTKMVHLADKQGHLRVVADEFSSPTYATDLAGALVRLIHSGVYGVYHFVNAGVASRYDFACKIMELTGRTHVLVEPISSSEFQRASTPPPYAPLRNYVGAELGISLRPWQDALADYVKSPIVNNT
ncbi:MAG: dTDP-4-dehydrorhamnose reductase [Thermoflexales bacterium]|nr:dTDP-4-dehydrorhamnose reductase [Thermoflexales bacterium]